MKDEHWGTALILRRPKGANTGAELKVYKVDIDDLFSGRGRNFKVASEDIVYIPKDSSPSTMFLFESSCQQLSLSTQLLHRFIGLTANS